MLDQATWASGSPSPEGIQKMCRCGAQTHDLVMVFAVGGK